MAESNLQTQLVSSEHPHLVSEQTARECLQHFIFELPDPEIQLYIQLGKGLDTFTLFPKLPLELRLKIWRSAFPNPRFVHIGPPCTHPYCVGDRNFKVKSQHIPLPITFQINFESRTETLKWYTVVLRDEKDKRRQPFFFDHLRDKLYLGYCHIYNDKKLSDWVEQLKAKAPGRLEKVNRLEFNGVWLQWDMKARLAEQVSAHDKHLTISHFNEPLLECVMHFSGLGKLDLWLTGEAYRAEQKGRVVEEFRALLEQYFEIHKLRFEGCKAPKVRVFHSKGLWSRRGLSGRAVENLEYVNTSKSPS